MSSFLHDSLGSGEFQQSGKFYVTSRKQEATTVCYLLHVYFGAQVLLGSFLGHQLNVLWLVS